MTTDHIAETIAGIFHATYETLAPDHGYKTREASAVAWDDVPAANKNLMIATVQHMLDTHAILPGAIAEHIAGRKVIRDRNREQEAAEALKNTVLPGLRAEENPTTGILNTEGIAAKEDMHDLHEGDKTRIFPVPETTQDWYDREADRREAGR